MSQLSNQKIIDAIAQKSISEVVELIKMFEETFGVSAAAVAVAAAPASAAAAVEVEEQTEFTVVVTSFGANKVLVIKEVRAITSLGLKEAKDLVETAPRAVIKVGVSKEEAALMKKQLEAAGATVVIE